MIIKDFTFQRHETLFYSKNPRCIKHLDPDQVKVVALWIVSAVDKKRRFFTSNNTATYPTNIKRMWAYILKANKFAEPPFQSTNIAEKVRVIFGPFWVILGPFWVIFGPLWAILGHFWPFLGQIAENLRNVQIFLRDCWGRDTRF